MSLIGMLVCTGTENTEKKSPKMTKSEFTNSILTSLRMITDFEL